MLKKCLLNEEIHETQDQLNELFILIVLCSEHRHITKVRLYLLAPRDQPETTRERQDQGHMPHGKSLWRQVL